VLTGILTAAMTSITILARLNDACDRDAERKISIRHCRATSDQHVIRPTELPEEWRAFRKIKVDNVAVR